MSQSSFVGYSFPVPQILHTLSNNYQEEGPLKGLFDEDVILFIQSKVSEVLAREYKQRILISRGDVVRVYGRVIAEFPQTIPKMIQRTVMNICNDFRIDQLTVDRNLKLEAHFVIGDRLYDPTTERVKYDPATIKLANRLGQQRVGGTVRFFFT
uniref:Uncharacterized protein n=1 Tax=Marseillevirus LCMAC101 TaxID=2506602 RepID=A0A481YR45_9VIRU|nr:MAG: uncharacterized protein LCMAC101_01260 [Marseillevirus LCMAC101]